LFRFALPLLEIASLLVRFDYIASFIADAIATVTVSLWGRMKS